jgi:acyl carrier protein
MGKQELILGEFKKEVANILNVKEEKVTNEARIYKDLGVDSLGLVKLGVEFQKRYDIELPPATVVEIKTVGQLYNKIKELVENNDY